MVHQIRCVRPEFLNVHAALIAIIDDDELVRNATSSLLRSLGYSTTIYQSADEFVGTEHGDVDCILSDLQMPGLSGLDLGRRLKDEGSGIPMILMTAFPTPGVRAQASALELSSLLEKPLNADRLADAVAQALAGDDR